jgi:hypothetical protein
MKKHDDNNIVKLVFVFTLINLFCCCRKLGKKIKKSCKVLGDKILFHVQRRCDKLTN